MLIFNYIKSEQPMITFSTLIKRITFNFARRIKVPTSVATTESIETVSFQQAESNINSPEQQHELMQQFVPLSSTVNTLKQKVKSDLVKQLAYEGEDPTPNKLVNRPAKGAVWGLGGQLIVADRKMELQGVRDDPEEIAKFLQLNQVKNVYIHDWKAQEDPAVSRRRYAIIGSCFSARHCWKVSIELKNALNRHMLNLKRNKTTRKADLITAQMSGGKDEEWTLVQYKDFEVHLMTEQQRQAMDLQWKWNNPVAEEVVEKNTRMNRDKKKRRSQFMDFD